MKQRIEQQAQQLELAAQLLRTGHPWTTSAGTPNPNYHIAYFLNAGIEIRPVLITPEDGRLIHNPLGLTAEQVGVGYRLALPDEVLTEGYEIWPLAEQCWCKGVNAGLTALQTTSNITCVRLPLSTPYPDPKLADPYAELKKAQAEGKVIQISSFYKGYNPEGYGTEIWTDCMPQWAENRKYRVKPEPKWEPLGPEDVPPGSVFRHRNWSNRLWVQPVSITEKGVVWLRLFSDGTHGSDFESWEALDLCNWQILRPSSTEWQPCRKEEAA